MAWCLLEPQEERGPDWSSATPTAVTLTQSPLELQEERVQDCILSSIWSSCEQGPSISSTSARPSFSGKSTQPLRSAKSAWRIAGRSVGLVLLVSAGAVWQLLLALSPAHDRQAQEQLISADQGAEHQPLEWTSSSQTLDYAQAHMASAAAPPARGQQSRRLGASSLVMVPSNQVRTDGCISGDVCLQAGKEYLILFYIIGILYMFVAVAIVCDEFFVPALETFVDTFDISMDVAGATFMAAGGSMPELCTSFIGTFTKSDVGFSTIVGSAVFNVLLVVGVCAIFSLEVLSLTWWPLFRDIVYYMLTLATLAVFFQDREITTLEALVLFLEYIGYCICMRLNEHIYAVVQKITGTPRVHPADCETSSVDDKALFCKPSMFRRGIIEILRSNQDIADTVGIAAITQIKGDVEATFRELDSNGNGFIDCSELATLLEKMGAKHDSEHVLQAAKNIGRNRDGQITFEAFSRWYMGSEVRMEVSTRRVFDKFDVDGSGDVDRNEVKAMMKSLGHALTDAQVDDILHEIQQSHAHFHGAGQQGAQEFTSPCLTTPTATDAITYSQFETWYTKSLFWDKKLNRFQSEKEPLGFSIDWPDDPSTRALFFYVFTYPICAALYITMPDVRRTVNESRQLVVGVCQFLMSLLWIICFSFCLVDWVTLVSNSIGIPVPVSAVTVLAAGTSIPDLLSSYIVARQGQADMAVSSSIGSNIFDICFGLPVPWLCFTLLHGENVRVKSESIGFWVLILLVMILCVVVCIIHARWKMTKKMGFSMLFLYVVFVVLCCSMELPEDKPLLPPPDF